MALLEVWWFSTTFDWRLAAALEPSASDPNMLAISSSSDSAAAWLLSSCPSKVSVNYRLKTGFFLRCSKF